MIKGTGSTVAWFSRLGLTEILGGLTNHHCFEVVSDSRLSVAGEHYSWPMEPT